MHQSLPLRLSFLLTCCLAMGACGSSNPQDPAPLPAQNKATEKCPGIYIFAPARYIVNLVVKDQIVIDPTRHPIPVYCTPEQAHKALKEARDNGKVPASMELRVYQLDGEWSDMVRKDGDKYLLNRTALLLDAVE
ncbi:MAG: hypothetical protein FWG59_01365 [Betaproteobacteria bacterium]|nr:hypothetical protein [Betaproteobacteria bacterium]